MVWNTKKFNPLETLARTGFLLFVCSYIIFWALDVYRPGFVSRYFSVHVFLLGSIVFGIVWAHVIHEYTQRPIVQVSVAFLLGILLVFFTWNLTIDLDAYRLIVAGVLFVTPVLVYTLIRN